MGNRFVKTAGGVLVLAVLLVASAGVAIAQSLPDPAEILGQAQEEANTIAEYRQLLTHENRDVRLAAFRAMAESDNAVLRSLAYDAGFASADATLRELALRYAVLERDVIVLQFADTSKTPLTLHFREKNKATGEFIVNCSPPREGKVIGVHLEVACSYCFGRLMLNDEDQLAGTYQCRGEEADEVMMRLR